MRWLETIHDLRRGNGYRQRDVAAVLGVSQSDYSRLERGEVAMTVNQLLALCAYLEVLPGEVLNDDAA